MCTTVFYNSGLYPEPFWLACNEIQLIITESFSVLICNKRDKFQIKNMFRHSKYILLDQTYQLVVSAKSTVKRTVVTV